MIWPECDPERNGIFQKINDRIFFSYMGDILQKGSKLHKERIARQVILDLSKSASNGVKTANANIDIVANAGHVDVDVNHVNHVGPVVDEMVQDDLFEVPPAMRAEVLQERFKTLYEKKRAELLEEQIKKTGDKETLTLKKKAQRWNLLYVLWNISKPTYIYAGWYQLATVLVQAANPLAVKYLLRLLEKYPNESIFSRGIGFAIALFLFSAIDGVAQERHKYLAFQSGILIRAATVTSIYSHMLNLTSEGKRDLLTGETINLVATDCQKLFEVCQEGHLIWSCPLSMIIVTVLLLVTFGPATLVGMATMFMLVPVVKIVVGKMMAIRKLRAIHSDKRIEMITAMLQTIRFCKLNSYEDKFLERIFKSRKEEMVWARKELAYLGMTMAVTVLTPVLACAVTFITYAMIDGNTLSASDTFTTLLLFSVLRFPINYAGKLAGKAAQGLEACERIANFLDRDANTSNKFLIAHDHDDSPTVIGNGTVANSEDSLIRVENGSFHVGGSAHARSKGLDAGAEQESLISSNDLDSDPDSGHAINQTSFTLSGINFTVKKSETLAVVGPVGSGKSTLLHALIGDVNSTSEIEMHGNAAYASQTPFILNATLRDNVLFGKSYDKEYYDKVIEACNLLPDLQQLGAAKDLTEIGERGVTLSGGQKSRIALARCVYARPKVAILDDVLSALDASTGKLIFERLFDSSGGKETLLSDSAVILVTHAAHFLSRVDKILVLFNGESKFIGDWNGLLSFNPEDKETRDMVLSIRSSLQEGDSSSEDDESESTGKTHKTSKHQSKDNTNSNETIMTEEERDFGLSDLRTWASWFQYSGGITFVIMCIIALAIDRGFYVLNELWLTFWTSSETEPNKIPILGISFSAQTDGLDAQYKFIQYYGIILVISFAATVFRSQWIIQGGLRCSQKLFNDMIKSIARAPMSYFETTPMGRILNRLTFDVEVLDISLSISMTILMTASGWFVTGLVLQISILPWNACVLAPIIAIYWLLLLYYRKSAVDLQRLDAISRSPVQANLAEGIDGSSTIRVFGKTDYFQNKFRSALNDNSSAMMNFMAAQRWLGVRFQILGSLAVLFAAVFVAVSESEAYLTSMERARDMADLPAERAYEMLETVKPNSDWPNKGMLSFQNVCFRYRKGLPLALNGLSFTAEPGQRIGICGRTGAGKSTISASLFRLAELDEGKIILDGIDLSTIALNDLRGRKNGMAIIPQDPTLFSGTIRECLDPFQQSDDKEILNALTSVKVADANRRGIAALNDWVDEGGRNFSVGERQLLCLARALLLKPRVLVLDEATASVDAETDAFIQKMIRSRFEGTTLLTVAHRLNTIMDYDIILVMDEGKVAELGEPSELLDNEDGLFSFLVDSTGKESGTSLRRMASQSSIA